MFYLKPEECIVLYKKQNQFFKAKVTTTEMAIWDDGDFMSNNPPRTQKTSVYKILSSSLSLQTVEKDDIIEIPRKILNRLIVDNM